MPRRYALVTGCSAGGLGPHIVEALHMADYHVFAAARQVSKIPSTIASLNEVTTLPLDLSSNSQIEAAVEEIKSVAGCLDVLVNNAGVGFTRPVLDSSQEDLRRVFDTNVAGTMELTKHCVPLMVGTHRPVVVNVSSIVGATNMPYSGVYAASKAALTALSEILRVELEPLDINVITLMLGLVETKLHPNQSFEPLPKSSFYTPISAYIHDMAVGRNETPSKSRPEDVARHLVTQIDKGAWGKIYLGALAWPVFKYIQWWLPTRAWDRVMRGLMGDTLSIKRSVNGNAS